MCRMCPTVIWSKAPSPVLRLACVMALLIVVSAAECGYSQQPVKPGRVAADTNALAGTNAQYLADLQLDLTNAWQRVLDLVFRLAPRELY